MIFILKMGWARKCLLAIIICTSMFSSFQLLSHVRFFATPWTAAHQASLSITNSRSLPKLMSIELVMPSNYLILCFPLLLLPSIFPSISSVQFSSVQSLSRVRLFVTPWTTACQASLSITNCQILPKPMSIVHGDAIQPSHPLSSPSPPALNLF